MLRLALPVVALSITLAGCAGGEGGCAGFTLDPNGAYTGTYSAVLTPQSGGRIEFAFSVDDEGAITGSVIDRSVTPNVDGTVSGYANDVVGCRPQAPGRSVQLQYTLDRTLANVNAYRRGRGELAGS